MTTKLPRAMLMAPMAYALAGQLRNTLVWRGEDWVRIPYGTAIDLGGCGKGYIGDQLADMMPEWVSGYWLSLGGDLIASGTDDNNEQWKIGIQSAANPDQNCGIITIPATGRYAIATSGTMHRKGVKAGKVWHHLIDPRTLQPAVTDMRMATVGAPTGLEADVLASCAVVLPHSEGYDFLQRHHVATAVLQYFDRGHIHSDHFGAHISIDETNSGTV